jgi:hypothetical protein
MAAFGITREDVYLMEHPIRMVRTAASKIELKKEFFIVPPSAMM